MQFVGTSDRSFRAPRTEYNTFREDTAITAGLAADIPVLLRDSDWTEAVFADLRANSMEVQELYSLANKHNWMTRVANQDTAYSVSTEGLFETYLQSLGPNTRLKLFNRRKVLETMGEVKLEECWPSNAALFFTHLNRLHLTRWEKPCFGEESLRFHATFLERLTAEGGKPHLSILSCNGSILSVLYNVFFNKVVYNIQAGYEENFHKKLSLGTLHLGYAIEEAFKDPETTVFDMLAGKGKNENYKSRLATAQEDLISLMLVKSRLFKSLYGLKD
jgi:hypothetical protein